MNNVTPLKPRYVSAEEPADEVLITGIARGDMGAMATLYSRYQRDVFRFLARLSGSDEQELDDLVQTTFVNVMRSARQFSYRSSTKSWLFAIASNVAKQHIRSAMRQKRAFRTAAQHYEISPETEDVCDLIENKEKFAAVEHAMNSLSYKLKVVFIMCDIEGIPGGEAARILGLREGTLWRRLHDARNKLALVIEKRNPR